MKKLKEIIIKYPCISSILIVALAISITFTHLPITNMDGQLKDYLSGIIEQVVVSILLIIGLKKLRLYEKARFSLKIKSFWLIWPIFYSFY